MKAVHTVPSKITRRHTIASRLSAAAEKCLRFVRKGVAAVLAALLVLVPITGAAAPLSLADSPLFLGISVKPNIMLVIDDSNSMDDEVLVPANDGAVWYHSPDQSFVGRDNQNNPAPGVINFNKTGANNSTWRRYIYLFPNGYSGSYNGKRLVSDVNKHYAVPPTKELAWTRSPDFNKAYYDPDVTYTPWASFGGTTFSDVNPTNAPWDPFYSGAGNVANGGTDTDTTLLQTTYSRPF